MWILYSADDNDKLAPIIHTSQQQHTRLHSVMAAAPYGSYRVSNSGPNFAVCRPKFTKSYTREIVACNDIFKFLISCSIPDTFTLKVVVVVNGSYSAAPYSSPDRECITKVKIKHRQSTQKKSESKVVWNCAKFETFMTPNLRGRASKF